jgi:hypothetical protein
MLMEYFADNWVVQLGLLGLIAFIVAASMMYARDVASDLMNEKEKTRAHELNLWKTKQGALEHKNKPQVLEEEE